MNFRFDIHIATASHEIFSCMSNKCSIENLLSVYPHAPSLGVAGLGQGR